MSARTPQETHARLEAALNRGDLDDFVATYEEDAALISPTDRAQLRGREAIRRATAPIVELRPTTRIEVLATLVADGLALTRARWSVAGTGDDGAPVELSGRGTIVSRRQPDGTWLIVLDDPVGPD